MTAASPAAVELSPEPATCNRRRDSHKAIATVPGTPQRPERRTANGEHKRDRHVTHSIARQEPRPAGEDRLGFASAVLSTSTCLRSLSVRARAPRWSVCSVSFAWAMCSPFVRSTPTTSRTVYVL